MNSRQPPAGATWILERLTSGSAYSPLAGDLIEEYQNGRSRLWYWRQVFTAVMMALLKELRSHPILAARAVAVGWAVLYSAKVLFPYILPFSPVFRRLPPSLRVFVLSGFLWWSILIPIHAVAGWVVGRFHRQDRAAMVLLFSISVLLVNFRQIPWAYALGVGAMGNQRYLPYLVSCLIGICLTPVGVLFGGLWGIHGRAASEKSESPA